MKIGANSFLWVETLTSNDFGILDKLVAGGSTGLRLVC